MKTENHVVLDHVAIAVEADKLPKLQRVLRLLGVSATGNERVENQGVVTHFYEGAAAVARVEILEAVDPAGVVAKFLQKRGPGIHHLCFRVPNVEEMSHRLRESQIKLIYDSPRLGAHRMQINFIHPESTGGILIEIAQSCESAAKGHA